MFNKHQNNSERLAAWRKFRQQDFTNELEIVQEIGRIKQLYRYIDYYNPDTWPTVFDIVAEGHYCCTGVTLILASTLLHKGFIPKDKIEFVLISNNVLGTMGVHLKHGNKYYNFYPGEISSAETIQNDAVVFNYVKLPDLSILS